MLDDINKNLKEFWTGYQSGYIKDNNISDKQIQKEGYECGRQDAKEHSRKNDFSR